MFPRAAAGQFIIAAISVKSATASSRVIEEKKAVRFFWQAELNSWRLRIPILLETMLKTAVQFQISAIMAFLLKAADLRTIRPNMAERYLTGFPDLR